MTWCEIVVVCVLVLVLVLVLHFVPVVNNIIFSVVVLPTSFIFITLFYFRGVTWKAFSLASFFVVDHRCGVPRRPLQLLQRTKHRREGRTREFRHYMWI